MKQVLILVLLVALGAGLLAFSMLMVGAPMSASSEGAADAARPTGAASTDADDLAALRGAVAELGARIERLELAAAAPSVAPGAQRVAAAAVSPEELRELRELASALRNPEQAGAQPFEQLVLGVIEAREVREREEREQARLDAAAERMERRVAELAEELGLSSFQSGEMLSILTGEQVERDQFFSQMRESGSFDRTAIRDGMEALRASTLASLEQVLSPDQYQRYVESSSGGFFGGGQRGPGSGGFAPGERGGAPPGR